MPVYRLGSLMRILQYIPYHSTCTSTHAADHCICIACAAAVAPVVHAAVGAALRVMVGGRALELRAGRMEIMQRLLLSELRHCNCVLWLLWCSRMVAACTRAIAVHGNAASVIRPSWAAGMAGGVAGASRRSRAARGGAGQERGVGHRAATGDAIASLFTAFLAAPL